MDLVDDLRGPMKRDYSFLLPKMTKREVSVKELRQAAAAGFLDPEPEPWKPLMTSWDLDEKPDTTAATEPPLAALPANALKHGG